MLAARGVWLLSYFSHQNVWMLDGGLKKWQADGQQLETRTNGFKPAKFDGVINPKIVADYEYINKRLDKLKLIDARSKEEFDGTVIRGARRGHIPNAINIDFNLNISEDGTLKDTKSLSELYKIPKDAEIVTYCQGAYLLPGGIQGRKLVFGPKKTRIYKRQSVSGLLGRVVKQNRTWCGVSYFLFQAIWLYSNSGTTCLNGCAPPSYHLVKNS